MHIKHPIHKHITLALSLTLACFLIPACHRDNLNLAPEEYISEATAFDTPDRIEKLRFGLYDALKYYARFMIYSDVRGEDFINELPNTGFGLQIWNHTQDASFREINEIWGPAYAVINSCNIFIEGVQKNKDVLNDDQLATVYEAEAKFIRGLAYYNLLTLYARPYTDANGNNAGVVLRLLPQPGSGNKDQARASVAEVYDQILKDLDFARDNLPPDHFDAYDNTTLAHRNTALALKTRVLLTMGRYQELIAAAAGLVSDAAPYAAQSGVLHTLQAEIADVFSAPYTTLENIFSLPYSNDDGFFAGAVWYNPDPNGAGRFSLNPDGILDDPDFDNADGRRQFVSVNPANDKPYLSKYPTGSPYTDFCPVIRYAEVLLNLAEAHARTGGLSQRALDLLNAVRGRSNSSGVYVLSDFASADELIDAILKERRIELLGEGFRSNDCMRLLLPIPGKENIQAIQPDDHRYIWPIPSSEIPLNRACEQNPGYD